MRFHKNVPLEHREFLTEQLKKYEKEMAMTSEERKELHMNNPGRNPSPVRRMEITNPFCWKSRFR